MGGNSPPLIFVPDMLTPLQGEGGWPHQVWTPLGEGGGLGALVPDSPWLYQLISSDAGEFDGQGTNTGVGGQLGSTFPTAATLLGATSLVSTH